MNNGTHCKHGIHYADPCAKCAPIYTEEELQEAIAEAKKPIPIINDLTNLIDFIGEKKGEILGLCVNPGRLEEVLDSLSTWIQEQTGCPECHMTGPHKLQCSRRYTS